MNLVSIIVPVHNVREYLDECIYSIRNQQYKNIEIVLVDDGSNDGCGIICDRHAKEDDRIKVIHQTNKGHGAACNSGMMQARGKHVCFCDADDYYFPHTVKRLVEVIEKTGAEMATGTAYAFDNETKEHSLDPYHALIRIPQLNKHDIITKTNLFHQASKLSVQYWDKIYDAGWLKKEKISIS
jgi:glycosyltransferase involved in cell wall biosynthesis